MQDSMDINAKLLTASGMALAHDALVRTYDWFLHETSVDHLASLRCGGLEARVQATAYEVDDVDLLPSLKIICLHPKGSSLIPRGSAGTARIRLALGKIDLPTRIGLDWSYASCWNLARLIQDEHGGSDDSIFLEVVRRSGSIVCYDDILPGKLRLCCKDSDENDPCTWPLLGDASDETIRQFPC